MPCSILHSSRDVSKPFVTHDYKHGIINEYNTILNLKKIMCELKVIGIIKSHVTIRQKF